MNAKRKLGNNPLSQKGIFQKTEPEADNQDFIKDNQDSRILNQDSIFLNEVEKEKVNLRLPIDINDWLDELVKKGKRNHGQKIPKEIWVQASLEYFQSLPVDWFEMDSVETLRSTLEELLPKIKKI